MKDLPENVVSYKRTKIFDENTVPMALLNDHNTKENVWGRIVVLEGELLYIIQSSPVEEVSLNSEKPGIVEPKIAHHVKIIMPVKFFVEFLKHP